MDSKSDNWDSVGRGFICFENTREYSRISSSTLLMYAFASFFRHLLINKIRVFILHFFPFVTGCLKLFFCQIMYFAFFFIMIYMLTKLILLNVNAFITAPPIVSKTDAIYFFMAFVSAYYDQAIKFVMAENFFCLSVPFIGLFKLFSFLGIASSVLPDSGGVTSKFLRSLFISLLEPIF